MSVPNMEFQIMYLFYRIKFLKYRKLLKIQGTSGYDINVSFISSPKDEIQIPARFQFFLHLKKGW